MLGDSEVILTNSHHDAFHFGGIYSATLTLDILLSQFSFFLILISCTLAVLVSFVFK
jgi:hypothetical protein